jgi:hypothetical protein
MSNSAPPPDDRPRLRPLDIIPVQVRGQQAFLLRDPQRLSTAELAVPPDIAFLLGALDGTRTIREAQVAYVRRFGSLLTTDKIAQLLRQLDEALLLDTERFRKFRAQLEADFRARPTRPAAHAGQSYPERPAAFVAAWLPKLEAASLPEDFQLDQSRPALIVPHYDMNGSADCYAAAYKLLGQIEPPEVVIVLGIAHAGGVAPFALTRKPYETPFGALEADDQIIAALEKAAPFDLYADEFLHRDEHSIEFQAVLLHFLFREQADPPRIVPVLCGSYHREDGRPADPDRPGPAAQFVALLRDALAADSRRVAVIASADLSHIGARFGQPPANPVQVELTRRYDLALLERAQAGDAHGLYQALAKEGDRYNVCGFPAIYALLRALPVKQGRLLSYRQAAEPQTQSCVSFASVGLR